MMYSLFKHDFIIQVAIIFNSAHDVTTLPERATDLINELEELKLKTTKDHSKFHLQVQVDELERFKRQLYLILDISGAEVPLSQILKQVRENKLMSDPLLRKQLQILKAKIGMDLNALDNQLMDQVYQIIDSIGKDSTVLNERKVS